MTLATGTVLINRYRIVRLVGQGGFGAVYRAWDMSLSQPVALKENNDGGVESQRQFEREAKLLAGLRHPNLPRVGDHFSVPGQGQYLVMDFIEGKSLGDLLAERGGPLPEAEVLPWIRQVCDGLEYLHSRTPPVIHRDIKPDNIIISPDGRAVLVDFGISKEFAPGKGTTIGAKAVTPGYSPPEQYASGKTDARSDVYALGATLYTLLTGQVPPEGPNLSSGAAVLSPPQQINRAISNNVSAAVEAAMATTISRRLGSAGAFSQALAGGTRVVTPQSTASKVAAPAPPPARRRSAWAWPLLLLLLVASAGAAWLALGQPNPLAMFAAPTEPAAPSLFTATPTATLTGAATAPAGATPGDAPTAAPGDTAAPTKTAAPDEPTATVAEVTVATATTAAENAAVTATTAPATATPIPPTATTEPVVAVFPADQSGPTRINQPLEQDGVSLTARAIQVLAEDDYGDHAARVWFRLVNKTGQRLLVDIDWTNIHLEDSLGTTYIDWDPGEPTSVWVETGENYDFDRSYAVVPGSRSRVPADAAFVQVVAPQFSRVTEARWQYDLNPALQAVAEPAAGTTKSLNEAWEQDGLLVRLTGLEVLGESDYGDHAARAWFEVVNQTNQELLVEIDYGRIAVIDSYGRRFGDWDGGGLYAVTLEAGETQSFNRYYSDLSGSRSRVTRGARFVVVQAESIGRVAAANWLVPLDMRLSSAETPAGTAPLRINQPWEQGGVSLTARTIEVLAEDDYGDHAARVWFRLVNKTGRSLLLPIDWNAIYLEDGQGTRYVDWQGGVTSVWVEAGGIFDFDRTYSVIPENRSRIPSDAAFAQVVVDRLSSVAAARWQYDINPLLTPAAEPAADTTKAVGEAWEQDGLALRLADLEVLAESDYGDHAARAWFELTNSTNRSLIAEVDFGHIALFDSFGRRFGDWEGGGIYAVTVEAGETITFNRYYSEMSGQPSRISRGSEWVVLALDSVAGITAGAWRLDIVR
ncbi:MAG: serine/threonine protein kinase [Candidatus Promineofilum sp.]|nr:serine/threonine protein kinase [Promineifilum sp.]